VGKHPAQTGSCYGQRSSDHIAHVVRGAVFVDDGKQVQHEEIKDLVSGKIHPGEDGVFGRMSGNRIQIRFAGNKMNRNNDAGHQHIGKPANDAVRLIFAVADKQRLNEQQYKPGSEHQAMDMLDEGDIIEAREQPEIGFEKTQNNDAEYNNKQQADIFVPSFHKALIVMVNLMQDKCYFIINKAPKRRMFNLAVLFNFNYF